MPASEGERKSVGGEGVGGGHIGSPFTKCALEITLCPCVDFAPLCLQHAVEASRTR